MNYTAVAAAARVPAANLQAAWPAILTNLKAVGIYTPTTAMGVIATVAVETAWTFRPIHEYGSEDYFNKKYDTRTDLGNTPEKDGDGALYCGRGYVQLTGKANYLHYGEAVGLDLVKNPNQAMEPSVAAAVLVLFFKIHHINVAADALDWTKVRRLVNGGTNGLQDFLHVINQLGSIWKESGDN